MMFCFKSILQIWIILIGFRDTNDFVNPGIYKHEFKFTCRGYCRFTSTIEQHACDHVLNKQYKYANKNRRIRRLGLKSNFILVKPGFRIVLTIEQRACDSVLNIKIL